MFKIGDKVVPRLNSDDETWFQTNPSYFPYAEITDIILSVSVVGGELFELTQYKYDGFSSRRTLRYEFEISEYVEC